MRTTNVYILADVSYRAEKYSKRMQQFIMNAERVAQVLPRVQTHIIGFNDRAKILAPYEQLKCNGNQNFAVALDFLDNILQYNKRYRLKSTRSIIIWLSSPGIINCYENAFYNINKQAEFANAIRYVISYGIADKCTKEARYLFATNINGVLDCFSENRLKRLVEQIKKSI